MHVQQRITAYISYMEVKGERINLWFEYRQQADTLSEYNSKHGLQNLIFVGVQSLYLHTVIMFQVKRGGWKEIFAHLSFSIRLLGNSLQICYYMIVRGGWSATPFLWSGSGAALHLSPWSGSSSTATPFFQER